MEIKPPTIETVPLTKLRPWEKNPRIKHAVDAIASSIESFGYLQPIVVQKGTYRILSGHGRLKALKKKKAKLVPVIIADVNDKNAELYTIADNRLGDQSVFDLARLGSMLKGLKKLELDLTGFTKIDMEKMFEVGEDVDEADAVSSSLKRVTFYAGDDKSADKVAANDKTLIVVFKKESQLQTVKKKIHAAQAGNAKTVGDVVFEAFAG